jgi:hypothetical protein
MLGLPMPFQFLQMSPCSKESHSGDVQSTPWKDTNFSVVDLYSDDQPVDITHKLVGSHSFTFSPECESVRIGWKEGVKEEWVSLDIATYVSEQAALQNNGHLLPA